MCGIAGELALSGVIDAARWGALTRLMARRGPDDEGFWHDEHCALGFRRLAILDLSPTGHQPMCTEDGRYVIVYNGELYNFQDLRRALEREGVRFRSTGDAEVVLYALARWGAGALERFNGMFALGLYDSHEKRLLLARDHAGIKPLYYALTPRGLVFASQYDQILAHPWSRDLEVSADALALYLRLGYIPAPYALLQHTHMLEPGSWLEIDAAGNTRRGTYFAFPRRRTPDLVGEEAFEAVNAAVTNAVRRQMISDVPLGVFLSGGIDSPLVAAKLQMASDCPVKAFTIGMGDDPLDESGDASRYAAELGVEHILEHVTPDQAAQMVEDVIAACGEPFADYSIFPTMLVSRLARQHVTVMLSGDGGDELFWGYAGRFGTVLRASADFHQPLYWRTLRWLAKKHLGIGDGYWNLRIPSIGDWYRAKHTHVPESWLPSLLPDVPGWPERFTLFAYNGWEADETAQWLRWNEFVGHLTMVLMKVDRASMYHSLEVRVPLLDREVIEIATRVDWRTCLEPENDIGKKPLRHALSKHVSQQTRVKRGFSPPISTWLKTTLRPLVEDVLMQRTSLAGVPFNARAFQGYFQDHLQGADSGWAIWTILSLALWEQRHWQPHRAKPVVP